MHFASKRHAQNNLVTLGKTTNWKMVCAKPSRKLNQPNGSNTAGAKRKTLENTNAQNLKMANYVIKLIANMVLRLFRKSTEPGKSNRFIEAMFG